MSKSHHTEAQMIGALKQLEAGRTAEDIGRELGVSKHTDLRLEGEVRRHERERGGGVAQAFDLAGIANTRGAGCPILSRSLRKGGRLRRMRRLAPPTAVAPIA